MVNCPAQKSPLWPSCVLQDKKPAHQQIAFPHTVQPSPHNLNRYLHIQTVHSEAFKYHFYVRTVRLWNLLPSKIATATSKDTFKLQSTAWITPMEWARVNHHLDRHLDVQALFLTNCTSVLSVFPVCKYIKSHSLRWSCTHLYGTATRPLEPQDWWLKTKLSNSPSKRPNQVGH